MSRFDAVRARWESTSHRHHHSDDSSTIPLLHSSENFRMQHNTAMDQTKVHHSLPGPNRRLTSGFGGMLNKQISTIRNKAFSRASRRVSSDQPTFAHVRQAGSVKSVGQSTTKTGKKMEKMVRSQTMSFLPVPLTSASRPPVSNTTNQTTISHTSAVSKSHTAPTAPRVSFSRPSYIPRSTTHPNLGTIALSGQRASGVFNQSTAKWLPSEDTQPLIRPPLIESTVMKTPASDEDWCNIKSNPFYDDSNTGSCSSQLALDSLLINLDIPRSRHDVDKENVPLFSSPRLPHVVQHHQLLQPLQPSTPPKNSHFRNFADTAAVNAEEPASPTHTVFANRQNLQRPPPLNLKSVPLPKIHIVEKAQPTEYWSGRFTSLNDKFLNESFDVDARPTDEDDVDSSNDSTVASSKTAQSKGDANPDVVRARRVFAALDGECTTDEARRSLMIFRNMYAIKTKMLELKCEIPATPDVAGKKEEPLRDSIGSSSSGLLSAGLRKISLMSMLRGRKSSGKSILSLKD